MARLEEDLRNKAQDAHDAEENVEAVSAALLAKENELKKVRLTSSLDSTKLTKEV